jgi:hypothetical protein
LETGKIYQTGYDDPDLEELEGAPDDIETSDQYLAVPNQHELGLGSDLPRQFARQQLDADNARRVEDIFHRSGAYRRFRDLLEPIGKLDAWYAFEDQATRDALMEWAADNGIEVMERTAAKTG